MNNELDKLITNRRALTFALERCGDCIPAEAVVALNKRIAALDEEIGRRTVAEKRAEQEKARKIMQLQWQIIKATETIARLNKEIEELEA